MYQNLNDAEWTVRAVGGLEHVPAELRGRTFTARVPGCIHTDLMRAGVIGDPDVGFNELGIQWIGEVDWAYECRFTAAAEVFVDEHIELACAGLDTIAALTLNEHPVGEADNQHHPHRFDVHAVLRPGENFLQIVFRGPLAYTREQVAKHGDRPVNYPWGNYATIRKSASNFGWDWGPRVATVGVWREIGVEAWSTARVASLRPLIYRAADDQWRVDVHVELAETSTHAGLRVSARLIDPADHREVSAGEANWAASNGVLSLAVSKPRLWQPRGYGEQARYRLVVELRAGERVIDATERIVGFRTVELDTSADEIGSAFTLRVNGQPVFCRGANWIPGALFLPNMKPERYRQRIQQAADANMNMLRVWGGGIYEDDAFYDACDELGVLIWQDFLFACATYPDEEPWRSRIEREARYQVARLSSRPSLVLWCGGNECLWAVQSWGYRDRLLPGQTWGRAYYFDVLPRIVAELDPTRPYWANSPYSGDEAREATDVNHGNRHTWDRHGAAYREIVPRFVSEFGHQAPPTYASLAEVWTAADFAVDSAAMAHRQRSSSNDEVITRALEAHFPRPATFDDWHYLAQLMQARSVSLAIEWLRANTPRCMGVLYWQLNDVWTGHSWSAIDVHGRAKPLWYATRRAYAPRLLTIQPLDGALLLCAVNDTSAPWAEVVTLTRRHMTGAVLVTRTLSLEAPPRSAVRLVDLCEALGELATPASEYYVATGESGRAYWFGAPDKALAYPRPRMRVDVQRIKDGYRLHILAESLLRDLVLNADRLDPKARVLENLVTLLPGETFDFVVRTLANLDVAALVGPPVLNCANAYRKSTVS